MLIRNLLVERSGRCGKSVRDLRGPSGYLTYRWSSVITRCARFPVAVTAATAWLSLHIAISSRRTIPGGRDNAPACLLLVQEPTSAAVPSLPRLVPFGSGRRLSFAHFRASLSLHHRSLCLRLHTISDTRLTGSFTNHVGKSNNSEVHLLRRQSKASARRRSDPVFLTS